jgi:hypothetical protein
VRLWINAGGPLGEPIVQRIRQSGILQQRIG